MEQDVNGCSTCPRGQEHYEEYYSSVAKKKLVQYDYRHTDDALFSTVASTLEICRSKKDEWLSRRGNFCMDQKRVGDSFFLLPKNEYVLGRPFSRISIIQADSDQYDTPWGFVRLYCTQYPDIFQLQIRALQSLKEGNKPRPIIASVSLTRDELKSLYEYAMNEEARSHETVDHYS